jgi:hypothetical protein
LIFFFVSSNGNLINLAGVIEYHYFKCTMSEMCTADLSFFFLNAIFECIHWKLIAVQSLRPVSNTLYSARHGTRALQPYQMSTQTCVYRETNRSTDCREIERRQCISKHVYEDSFVIHDIEHRFITEEKTTIANIIIRPIQSMGEKRIIDH